MKTAFCFDLDGTVTSTEILPCIAADLGVADEIATLTRATMDGHIDFEPSFRLRCLILGQVAADRVRSIVGSIPLDEHIVAFIRSRASDCFLVTGNLDIWVEPVADYCGAKLYSSTAAVNGDKLSLRSILDKGTAISDIRHRFEYERVVAIGDGANDVPMLSKADVAVAFGGVHPPAHSAITVAHYVVQSGVALCSLLTKL